MTELALFLTDKELHELTGYHQPSRQVAMLRQQGVPFHVNASGHPKVARATLEGRRTEAANQTRKWEPKWAANHR